jgi:hypothetical protein
MSRIRGGRGALLLAGALVLASVALAGAVTASSARSKSNQKTGRHAGVLHPAHPTNRFTHCWQRSPRLTKQCIERVAVAAARRARAHLASALDTTNPWLADQTNVNPGSAIQFVSPAVGWRVDGEYAAPWLDDELTSGPGGTTVTWPGGSVSKSTDGGATWTSMKSDPSGVWSVDFLSPDLGWVVGVASLMTTTDGGSTWKTLGEPAGHPLVTVQFASTTVGLGLTTRGELVQTQDGGASWRATSLPVPGTALCVAGAASSPAAAAGYVSDARGDVFASTDAGATWTESYHSSLPAVYAETWSDLACDSASAWQDITVISPFLDHPAFLVASRPAAGATWTPVATNPANGPELAPSPPGADGFESVQGIVSTQGTAFLAGLPSRGFAAGVGRDAVPDAGTGAAPAATPAAPSSPVYTQLPASANVNTISTDPGGYIRVLGTSSVGSGAWIYVLDAAVDADPTHYATFVLATHDGGSSWSVVNNSGAHAQPQYP